MLLYKHELVDIVSREISKQTKFKSNKKSMRMRKNTSLTILGLVLVLNVISSSAEKQVYIVYLGEHRGTRTFQEIENLHHSFLHLVKGSKEEAEASILYSYKNVINGFSAWLTPDEATAISKMKGVVSVFHSHPRGSRLHTTRSWDFINLLKADWDPTKVNGEQLLTQANQGKDVIVGLLDSGVWPESQSFNDAGMEPVPTSWTGTCEAGVAFNSSNCNRKLIGARYYLKGYEAYYGPLDPQVDYRSPRDINGHGTHTSSTVGGRRVPNAAALGGLANGTASGGAPLVRLAIYKVCWPIPGQVPAEGNTCMDDDMLAAFDDAISDGVHVISVSIGSQQSRPYAQDSIAIGSLFATKNNIVVACSAGNSGPSPSTVVNVAPWIITVGASSIDRVFSSPAVLGNGLVVEGQSVTPFKKGTYPLVYAAAVEIPGTTTRDTTGMCYNGTLSPSLVKGKAVFCWRGDTFQALEVQRAGGAAAVLGNLNDGIGFVGRPYLIPGTVVIDNQTMSVYNYTVDYRNAATVTLTPPTTLLGTKPAPFMAPFSSQGPNPTDPNILKPDITAPGLNILAAYSEAAPPLGVPQDPRRVKFQLDSGTSMACPHVASAAALLRAVHPDWSSAAIRSALITTAKLTNNVGELITDALGNSANPFQFGSGHVQPSKAVDPGLVYDASYDDYLLFLCSSGNNTIDPTFECPLIPPSASELNYPSLTITGLVGSYTVSRTVTNVGPGNGSYTVGISAPPGYSVQITPQVLSFTQQGETQSFDVTVTPQSNANVNEYAFGLYQWSDGIHQVTSVITVSTAV